MSARAAESYALFDTARGTCAVAWRAGGITRVQLPEASRAAAEARLRRDRPEARERRPVGQAKKAARLITEHLDGRLRSFAALRLDLATVTPFRSLVYTTLRDSVKHGSFVTYGELARRVGAPGAARAVGQAMACNPFPLVVPCHRVLAAGQRIGGFSAHGGPQTKVDLLALEQVTLPGSALGLCFEPAAAAAALSESDPLLGSLIARVGPLRLLVDPLESPFVALMKAIIYQQLTGKAAHTIFMRVVDLFDGEVPTPETLLGASEAELRSVGLSRAKAAALQDLAQKVRSGVVPPLRALVAMDDEAIVERLVAIRGIGRWTAEMLLMFRLGRPDVLPIDDYGMRKGLSYLLGKKQVVLTPRQVVPWGEKWRPYRTAASWYLWRAAELGPEAVSACVS